MTIPSVLVAIVEDEVSQGKALAHPRAVEGFTTATFPSAEAYFCTAIVPTPLCIIVDLNLPGMSGLDLLDRLLDADGSPPIIVTTAGDETVCERARRLGAFAVFPKPIDGQAQLTALLVLSANR
jgi:FixJ family two-component response regulator